MQLQTTPQDKRIWTGSHDGCYLVMWGKGFLFRLVTLQSTQVLCAAATAQVIILGWFQGEK